jgi:hypothetical protein
MPRCLCHRLLLALSLPLLGGVAVAGLHDGSGLERFPGQAADVAPVVTAAGGVVPGYGAHFGTASEQMLRLPFSALESDGRALQYGPLVRYRPGEQASTPVLAARPEDRDRYETGGFVTWRSGAWQVSGSTLGGNPLAGETGLLGLTGSYALQSNERLTLVFSGSASYASDDYLRQRVLDERAQALDQPGPGDLGLSVNASYRLGTDWSMVGMFGVHHSLDDDAGFGDTAGQQTRFRAGATFRYDF